MSHEVERVAYVGALPWWETVRGTGLGHKVDEHMSWDEAIEAGGLAWQVKLGDVYANTEVYGHGSPYAKISGHKAVIRETDSKVLGMVTDQYKPIQNTQAFAVFERLFGDQGRLETVGSLRGGQTVFGLARLKDTEFLGETHRRYLLCQTRHDGSGACLWFPTGVRVICMNTNNLALSNKADRRSGAWVSHTGDVTKKIDQAADALQRAFAQFSRFQGQCEALADTKVSINDAAELIVDLFPGDTKADRERQSKIMHLTTLGRGNIRFAGSAYAVYNGITEYVDHHTRASHSKNILRRFDYSTMGSGAQLKAKAFHMLLKAA